MGATRAPLAHLGGSRARGVLQPRVDAGGKLLVALGVGPETQLVLANPAELCDDRALRRVAAEQRGDADRVRRELLELRVQLPLAAVAPEVAPLVRAPRPHWLWFTASTLFPSGSRTKAPTYPGWYSTRSPGAPLSRNPAAVATRWNSATSASVATGKARWTFSLGGRPSATGANERSPAQTWNRPCRPSVTLSESTGATVSQNRRLAPRSETPSQRWSISGPPSSSLNPVHDSTLFPSGSRRKPP